ncbi:hypothetical protein Pcinc_012426 [Petrolisthes cinctipes]|uniref:C3H1-type domain-containing protein n=1 Tax=Petrolisthes cinctipes TaxID=88211 RepID=A0AAE1KSL3_PETCI|nr:hypothetical protein Pcinc_012426 [Petrolisthes cinctipes]
MRQMITISHTNYSDFISELQENKEAEIEDQEARENQPKPIQHQTQEARNNQEEAEKTDSGTSNQPEQTPHQEKAAPNQVHVPVSDTQIQRKTSAAKVSQSVNTTKTDVANDKSEGAGTSAVITAKTSTRKICSFYRKNNCKYGRKDEGCNYNHPKVCPKLLQFGYDKARGCNLGNKCQNYHPKLCRHSVHNRTCSNKQCRFTHLRGTLRNASPNDTQAPKENSEGPQKKLSTTQENPAKKIDTDGRIQEPAPDPKTSTTTLPNWALHGQASNRANNGCNILENILTGNIQGLFPVNKPKIPYLTEFAEEKFILIALAESHINKWWHNRWQQQGEGMGRWIRMPHFLRRFIRNRTKEMPYDFAQVSKRRLSFVYAFCMWNIFGFIAYKMLLRTDSEKENKNVSQGRHYMELLNLKNAQLYHVKGISSIQRIDTEKEADGVETSDEHKLENLSDLENNIALRGLSINVHETASKWTEWRTAMGLKVEIEEKRSVVTKALKALQKNPKQKDRAEELKEQGRKLRSEAKVVMEKIWDLEETVIIPLLQLPNILHHSTPSVDELLFSFLDKPTFTFSPKSHLELGKVSGEVEFLKNSPTSYYLKGHLALLELAFSDYFLSASRTHDFLTICNSDFVKAAVVEGSGVHCQERHAYNKLSSQEKREDPLHLVGGGSVPAFAAFITKQIVEKAEQLPQKFATSGRNYLPVGEEHQGLFGCRQRLVVDGFVMYIDKEGMDDKQNVDKLLMLLIQSYSKLGLHFRVVQYSGRSLSMAESAAFGVQMYSPYLDQYEEVGRITLCGNYISKRLWTLCKLEKKCAQFTSSIHIRFCNITGLLGLLMENSQTGHSAYVIPEYMQSLISEYLSH